MLHNFYLQRKVKSVEQNSTDTARVIYFCVVVLELSHSTYDLAQAENKCCFKLSKYTK